VAPRTPVKEVVAGIWAETLLILRLLADVQATFDQETSIRTVISLPMRDAWRERSSAGSTKTQPPCPIQRPSS